VSLRQTIEQEIRERGPIPFSRYMELCLYHPEFGYYSRAQEKFGKAGDFYTSSDVHAVFGRLLARQFQEMWCALDAPARIELLELGPGRGLFAQDVLDWSKKKFPDFFRALHYTLVETSPALRERLAERFREQMDTGTVSLLVAAEDPEEQPAPSELRRWSGGRPRPSAFLSESPGSSSGAADASSEEAARYSIDEAHEQEGHGLNRAELADNLQRTLPREVPLIVFGNEFFDALPVEILSPEGSLRIDTRDGRFLETWAPPSPQELEFLDRYGVHPETSGRTEVALVAQRTMTQIAVGIERGFVIAVDYGYTREEQLAGRHLDTIMTYRRHTASADPYQAPGEQDITAHVNFTSLAAAAQQNGMLVHKLLTQSQFLMGIGESTQFADAFEDCRLPQERAKVALQLKHLVTPEGMGETFHVLVAGKGVERDAMDGLSGLNFSR
jgi:SAM-dependent MidA family methyltransferase